MRIRRGNDGNPPTEDSRENWVAVVTYRHKDGKTVRVGQIARPQTMREAMQEEQRIRKAIQAGQFE